MNNQLKVENRIVTQSNDVVHCFGGKQKEFGRIISDLKTEIERLKTIRSRYFWNNNQGLIACSHL